MSRKNDIIERNIEGVQNRMVHQEVQLEFYKKKGDEKQVERIQEQIKEYEEDIEIWESLKE